MCSQWPLRAQSWQQEHGSSHPNTTTDGWCSLYASWNRSTSPQSPEHCRWQLTEKERSELAWRSTCLQQQPNHRISHCQTWREAGCFPWLRIPSAHEKSKNILRKLSVSPIPVAYSRWSKVRNSSTDFPPADLFLCAFLCWAEQTYWPGWFRG